MLTISPETNPARITWRICFGLVVATLLVYWPVTRFDFINYDDPGYVTENPFVSGGLTWQGVRWAFATGHSSNPTWHPVTWISHMLDCQVFGMRAGGHHLTSLLLHIANTLLLFFLLKRMTAALWRSACVAALFALHPIHVESVTWIAERKDVLSTFFGLLCLWFYVAYSQLKIQSSKFKVRGSRFPASLFYSSAILLFACSLMSKPMLVTLPFLLLLLDYWPLGRLSLPLLRQSSTPPFRLILEKLPFFALAAASCAVTFLVQKAGHAVISVETVPMAPRIANALVAYFRYVEKLILPGQLALPYLNPSAWPPATVAFAAFFLLATCGFALKLGRRRPYLAVGWFWFLGTLVPVIGLVQFAPHAMADRYTYIPAVGLFMLFAWLLPDLFKNWRHGPVALRSASVAVLLVFLVLARLQTNHWQNSESLFRHGLAVNPDNYVAHDQLGEALASQGRIEEARAEYSAALALKPRYIPSLSNLSKLLFGQGNFPAAAALLKQVLEAHPNDALTHSDLAIALVRQGKVEEAIPHHLTAVRLNSDRPEPLNNLAWLLATHPSAEVRNGAQAVPLAERACSLTAHTNLSFMSTLAAAYAEAGRFTDAINIQQRICDLTASRGEQPDAQSCQRRLELYFSRQPYRTP